MTTTKFTNNVVRAKAVKALTPKRGVASNKPGSKFSSKVVRASAPKGTNLGQVAGGGKAHTIGGKSGNSYGGSTPPQLNIKGSAY